MSSLIYVIVSRESGALADPQFGFEVVLHPRLRDVHRSDWLAVISLLEAVGTVEQQHSEKNGVTVGTEAEVLDRPKHKNIDVQQVIDVRHC